MGRMRGWYSMSGKTIIEKILSEHSGEDARAGDRVWADLDLAVVRDFGGPNVVLEYEKQLGDKPVWIRRRSP